MIKILFFEMTIKNKAKNTNSYISQAKYCLQKSKKNIPAFPYYLGLIKFDNFNKRGKVKV